MITLPTRLELIKLVPDGSVGAEIGVWKADFSFHILDATGASKLYSVDTWGPFYDQDQAKNEQEARSKLMHFGHRSEILKMTSLEAAEKVPMLDFAYIDASHDLKSVSSDLLAWSKRINKGGAIYGRHYMNLPETEALGFKVVEAVDAFCANEGWLLTHLSNERWNSYRLERIAA